MTVRSAFSCFQTFLLEKLYKLYDTILNLASWKRNSEYYASYLNVIILSFQDSDTRIIQKIWSLAINKITFFLELLI